MKNFTRFLSLAIVAGGLIASLPAEAATYFRENDRVILRSYITTTTTTDANGDTVTYYTPGTVLPDTVTYKALPSDVTVNLLTPPPGTEYVVIGRSAYLINPDKRVIIEAERLD